MRNRSVRIPAKCVGVCLTAVFALTGVFVPARRCDGQFGQAREDVTKLPGIERADPGPRGAFDQGYATTAIQGEKITTIYLLSKGHVCGLRLRWPTEVPFQDALTTATKATGLPMLPPPRKKGQPDWIVDQHQSSAFPVLGASELRVVSKPLARLQVGTSYQWTDHYTKWGQFIGKSDFTASPIFKTYSVYLGEVPFTATKAFLPIVRRDGAAYMSLEVVGDSASDKHFTRQIQISEPESFWRGRFAELRQLAKHLTDRHTPPANRSLRDLRPFHLAVWADYKRTVLDFVPPDQAVGVIDTWRANALVGAVDNEHVPWSAIVALRSECPELPGRAALMTGIDKTPLETRIRRARALDEFGSLEWLKPMVNLLKKEAQQSRAVEALRLLALPHAASPEELEVLGDDFGRWNKWTQEKLRIRASKQ